MLGNEVPPGSVGRPPGLWGHHHHRPLQLWSRGAPLAGQLHAELGHEADLGMKKGWRGENAEPGLCTPLCRELRV